VEVSSCSSRALHRFAVLTAGFVLVLIGAGGLVTSHGAGLAVPDWPNTYGYNMFFFPVSAWIGGIFYEHTHRLLGAWVGLLTLILAVWMHGAAARPWLVRGGWVLVGFGAAVLGLAPGRWQDAVVLAGAGLAAMVAGRFWPQGAPQSRRLRRLSLLAVGLVVLQGVLGGLRVVWLKEEIGIVHATLAQLFLILMAALALFTSPWWKRFEDGGGVEMLRQLRPWYVAASVLILVQLILGATMRHEHAGLAVPDFPLAYGRLWPATDAESVARYNRERIVTRAYNDITATHIHVHMAHRVMALVVTGAIAAAWWRTRRCLPRGHMVRRVAGFWLLLVCIQFGLGAWTVWSDKAADVATLHVVTGALTFVTGALLSVAAFGARVQGRESALETVAVAPATVS
jgi:cytochrome c oxidase assembly protein subunit 15